jgi:preprotein translocase subunit YajC
LSPGRAYSSAWIKQSSFPETNFLAGVRFEAGFVCALNGSGGFAAKGKQRMSVATGLAILAGLPAGAGGGSLPMLLPLLLIPVLYLVMIRPQQKRQKEWQAMLGGIKAGDRVTTSGGIRGIILSIKDDVIVIRVAPDNIKLEVAKSAIASVTQEGPSGA